MVICLLIMIRHRFALTDLITREHLDKCAKYLLISGSFVTYCYILEFFTIWYAQEHFEMRSAHHEAFGPKAWVFWTMLTFNSVFLQSLWFPKLRKKEWFLFTISLFILMGMWMERYIIITTTLSDTFLPAMKSSFSATRWDWMLFAGTFGLFGFGMLVVVRFLPFIPITELKEEKME